MLPRYRPARTTLFMLLAFALNGTSNPARAGDIHEAGSPSAAIIETLGQPVASSELDQMRGGFVSDNGLEFAFSFDSVTRVNGDVLSQTSVVVPVLSLLDSSYRGGAQAMALADFSRQPLAGTESIGSLFSPVVLQNSLDGQVIETLSVLDLQVYGTANLGSPAVHGVILPATILSLKQ